MGICKFAEKVHGNMLYMTLILWPHLSIGPPTSWVELVDHAMKEGEPLVSCDPTFYATFKTADGGILFSCPSYETTTELV